MKRETYKVNVTTELRVKINYADDAPDYAEEEIKRLIQRGIKDVFEGVNLSRAQKVLIRSLGDFGWTINHSNSADRDDRIQVTPFGLRLEIERLPQLNELTQ